MEEERLGRWSDDNWPDEEDEQQDLPAVFRSWNQFYAFVLIELGLLVGIFYWLTQAYS